jgi:D-alanyl-D-alanine carboxypeptidase
MDMMVHQPDRMWTIPEVIRWTQDNLDAHSPPGEGFHYSDTGYELQGLIIEKATGTTYEKTLHQKIFEPLEMEYSHLMFYSRPAMESPWPMCDLYYKGINLARTNSASFNRAAGGVVTTAEDLLKFIKAIQSQRLISAATFEKMQDWARFGPGIDYGFGLMRFRFIGAPKKYTIWGNSGSIGTYMYYNPRLDTYFIGTFNHVNHRRQPIIFLVRIMRIMFKTEKNQRH